MASILINQEDTRTLEKSGPQAISIRLPDELIVRTIMDNSQDTIYFKDRDSRFLLNSFAHARQFGFSDPRDLVGKSDWDFFPESFVRQSLADEQEIMRTGIPIIGRVEKWEREDGSVVWLSASKYPLYDAAGRIVGTWGSTRDISALKAAEEELEQVNGQIRKMNAKLRELAVVDELSGLYNHRNFYDILRKTVHLYSRRSADDPCPQFCVALLDIDHFKAVNDSLGHLAGDAVIRHVSALLQENIRSSDYAFRYGGDEFALILPDCGLTGGRASAEHLRAVLEASACPWHGSQIRVTASIGVTCFTGTEESEVLIHDADSLLYRSKTEGRNRVS